MLHLCMSPVQNRLRRFHLIEIGPIEVLDSIAFRANEMVVVHYIDVPAGSMIDMVNSLNQPILFERCNCPVNSIKGYCFEVLSNLIKHVFGCWVIRMFQQCPENHSSLVGYPESVFFADSLKVVHSLGPIGTVILHSRCNNLFWRIVPI